MTTIDQRIEAAKEVQHSLQVNLQELIEASKKMTPKLRTLYVIDVAGVYIKFVDGKSFPCGPDHATRFNRPQAIHMAPQVRNGNGTAGVAVGYLEALNAAIVDGAAALRQVTDILKDLAHDAMQGVEEVAEVTVISPTMQILEGGA
ncbi:hypothetical protein HOT36_gp12 [Ralstonia phage RPSC1]|uniref:Uncharacterized protein n=1 Tax=Ralstonia phage RPSC1 TaxID=2041351 RepID=A0A2Z2UBV4_9CAUD|nr:hypothetical protein HOT36_gp12 [Ralstonia phage RPSC1]ATN92942.1 hypothetical protein RPSC1_11 [Ralstonia phage RPSC1]